MPDALLPKRIPLAYLLTFRTYGTWHHGDSRGSVDRRGFNRYRSPKIAASERLVSEEMSIQKRPSFHFTDDQRVIVGNTINEVCRHRGYELFAANVQTSHVHAVVNASISPEKIVEAFKSYSTRNLRNAKLIDSDMKVWSRHASTRYLWDAASVTAAISYVLYDQGDEFPNFEELVG